MIFLLCACVGAFGDRQGHYRALVPRQVFDTKLTDVRLLHTVQKPWSVDKYSAVFRGQKVFLKTAGVRAERAYYDVGVQMGFKTILLPSQFDMKNNVMLTPLVKVVSCGNNATCRNNCANPSFGVRHAMIAALDYVMGYVDRPMNCHYVNNNVFAIDNDSMTEHDDEPKRANNDYQWQYVPDRATISSLCDALPAMRLTQLHLPGVRSDKIVARHNKLLLACAATHRAAYK